MKLTVLQDRLFGILCVIDDICRENKISYWLTGGTELGAVREKDFIPWDDDIDIKVSLDEYVRFRKAMKENLPEHLHFIEPDAYAPYFYDFIVRVYDDRWLLRTETEEDRAYGNLQNRACVDIFIMIGVPDSKIRRFVIVKKFQYLYLLGMGHRYRLDFKKYSGSMKPIVHLFSRLGRKMTMEKIFRKWQKTAEKSHKNSGRFVIASNTIMKDFGIVEEKEIYSESVEGIIRNRAFPIPIGYDTELTKRYGDYMTPVRDDGVYTRHIEE